MVETRRAASPAADELLLRLAHKTCPAICAIARAAAVGDAARRVSTLGPFRLRSRKAAPSASIFAVLCSFQPLARLHSIRIALIAPHTRYETASTGSIRNASGVKLVNPGQRGRGSFLRSRLRSSRRTPFRVQQAMAFRCPAALASVPVRCKPDSSQQTRTLVTCYLLASH